MEYRKQNQPFSLKDLLQIGSKKFSLHSGTYGRRGMILDSMTKTEPLQRYTMKQMMIFL
jgi:hypothetical protein